MTIFRFALIRGLRSPATFIFNCVLPLLLILVRPLWTGEVFLSGFGVLIMLIWGGTFLMCQNIITDRTDGALTRILAGPVSMLNYLTQNLLAYMIPLTVQVALISVLGALLYGWSLSLVLAFVLCYTIFTMTSVAMSFAWNCLFKSKDSSFSTFTAVVTFGTFLSGALIPLELLPTVLQYVGAVFPAYWAARALSFALEGSATIEYWIGIAVMVLFTAAYLLYGGKRRMI